MKIKYALEKNSLTVPPSYYCRPEPNTVFDVYDVARNINLENPTITESMCVDVLNTFATVCLEQLSNGSKVTLKNFFSIYVTMPVLLESPTDPLPPDPLDCKATAAPLIKLQVSNKARYERQPYLEKNPHILGTSDTSYDIYNFCPLSPNSFRIQGGNISYDISKIDEGVFIRNADGGMKRQTNISLLEPSNIILIPEYASIPTRPNNVEKTIFIATRYTENGRLRTAEIGRIRSMNVIEQSFSRRNIFTTGNNLSDPGPMVVASSEIEADVLMVCRITKTDNIAFSLGLIGGNQGDEVLLSRNEGGQYFFDYEISGDNIILGMLDYDVLRANLLLYGKYMKECCSIPVIA